MTIKVLIGRHILYMEIFGIKIGGFSNEFDPGIGSDSDLNMKLQYENVRYFKGINNFKTYHFESISLRKKKISQSTREVELF